MNVIKLEFRKDVNLFNSVSSLLVQRIFNFSQLMDNIDIVQK